MTKDDAPVMKAVRNSRNGSDESASDPGKAHASFESRIRAHYASLPDSERRIADLILEFPGEISAYSATELAELSGGSKAAVTRLVQRIGFVTFEEARRAARDAKSWGSPLYLLKRNAPVESFTARVEDQIRQDVQNIARTLESLGAEVMDEIVESVAGARRVFLLGYRNSHYLAGYLRWQIIQVRGDVYLLPAAGETLAEEIADLSTDDLLIVIGFRRRVAEVPHAMAVASKSGAKVLYVTDWSAEPSSHATWTLPCAVKGSDLFDRYAAAMSLLHFLSVSIVNRLAGEGRARLKFIEKLHEDLEEFE